MNAPDAGAPALALNGAATETQSITLQEGWNLVSSRIIPNDPALESIFAPIASDIALVKDEGGQIYQPGEINAIGDWDIHEGYMVYAIRAQTLTITGSAVAASESISLDQGWNIVSYLPSYALSAEDGFASVEDNLVLAKDTDGDVYYPDQGLNTIGDLEPGQGYKLYLSAPATLTYASSTPPGGFAYNPNCLNAPGAVKVEDYGTLTPGVAADSTQRAANTTTINNAIATVPNGTSICLPADSLYLAWNYDPTGRGWKHGDGHIVVNRDSIALWGAGACGWGNIDGCTYIQTPGAEDEAYYGDIRQRRPPEFKRGVGIMFVPRGYGNGQPTKHITLKGFELNGGAVGFTGDYSFTYDYEKSVALNGWDLSSKGIYFNGDSDHILIEDVKVTKYMGEVIYNGGFDMGTVTLRRVWSFDSNGSAYNVATAQNQLVEDSKFGPDVRFWGELQSEGVPNATSIHRNNTYEDCGTGNGCLAIAVDTYSNLVEGQSWTWENNDVQLLRFAIVTNFSSRIRTIRLPSNRQYDWKLSDMDF